MSQKLQLKKNYVEFASHSRIYNGRNEADNCKNEMLRINFKKKLETCSSNPKFFRFSLTFSAISLLIVALMNHLKNKSFCYILDHNRFCYLCFEFKISKNSNDLMITKKWHLTWHQAHNILSYLMFFISLFLYFFSATALIMQL